MSYIKYRYFTIYKTYSIIRFIFEYSKYTIDMD
jgi:hypothetical protein